MNVQVHCRQFVGRRVVCCRALALQILRLAEESIQMAEHLVEDAKVLRKSIQSIDHGEGKELIRSMGYKEWGRNRDL
eukprot:4964847-Amphidinium_carterae.1